MRFMSSTNCRRIPPILAIFELGPTQMLDELAIKVGADLRAIRLDRDLDVGIGCDGWTYPSDKTCRRIRAGAEKSPAIHAISIYRTTLHYTGMNARMDAL